MPRNFLFTSLFLIFFCLFITSEASFSDSALGVKEFIIDSNEGTEQNDHFDHTGTLSTFIYFQNHHRILNNLSAGYFMDKADLSDPNLRLSTETNGRLTSLVLPGKNDWALEDKNSVIPSLGELRLSGWKFETNSVQVTSDNAIYQDDWNNWSTMTPNPSGYTINKPSLPVGGLNYIYQSFKIYRSGQLAKLRLKMRRHPGVSAGTGNGIYITIIANDPSGYDKPHADEASLGYGYVSDKNFLYASNSVGMTSFENIDVVFKGVNRPTLVAGKKYWMKISTISPK